MKSRKYRSIRSLLAAIRDKKIRLNSEIVDMILNSLDYIGEILLLSEKGTEFEIDKSKIEQIEKFQIPVSKLEKQENLPSIGKETLDASKIPSEILKRLLANIQTNQHMYLIEILYSDQEFKNGYDPFVLLKSIRKNSSFYIALTDKTVMPPLLSFSSDILYFRTSIYCNSSLSPEKISDLSFDSSLLKIFPIISNSIAETKEEIQNFESIDADMLNEFLTSIEDMYPSIESAMLEYEKDYSDSSLNRLFRYIHTIKGDSDYIGLKKIVSLAHKLESLLDNLRKRKEQPNKDKTETIFRSVDEIYANLIELNKQTKRKTEINLNNPRKILEAKPIIENNISVRSEKIEEVFLEQIIQIHEMIGIQSRDNSNSPVKNKNITRLILTLSTTSINIGIISISDLCQVTLKKISTAMSNEEVKLALNDLLSFVEGFIGGKQKKLGEILIEEKIISPKDLQEALKQQKPIGEILVESGKATEEDIRKALRAQEIYTVAKQGKPASVETQTESTTMRIDESKVEVFYNLIGELIVARNTYDFCISRLSLDDQNNLELVKAFKDNLHVVSRVTKEMQSAVLSMRMVPVKTVFQKFHRIVRDIARKQKKEIELSVFGEEVEIDKRVADTLSDPLVHLIRNACDHGIESAEERLISGKPMIGSILLKASFEGNHVVIRIIDDGKGLNSEKIANQARIMGYNTENMTEDEIYNLIFLPGLSTASKVTDVSGRGVGMDVVHATAKSLGGYVSIKSKRQKGTETIISIPVSMGVSKALIIESKQSDFAIPLENVIEALKVSSKGIHLLQDRLILNYRGEILVLHHLDNILNSKHAGYIENYTSSQEFKMNHRELSIVVLCTNEGNRFAVLVDKLKQNMEIAIKPLPKQLGFIDALSGVTIMGDGKIVQVLNINGLQR